MSLGDCPNTHSAPLRAAYLADKAAGKVSYESELRDHLARLRLECDRRVARSFDLLVVKDPELRNAPSVARLVDTHEAHALDDAVATAEAAVAAGPGGVLMPDPVAEAACRAAIDERAMVQGRHCAAGFASFTGKLAAAADVERQADLSLRAAAKLSEAEKAGEEGRVDDAQKLTEEAEQLKALAAQPAPKPPGPDIVRILEVRVLLVGEGAMHAHVHSVLGLTHPLTLTWFAGRPAPPRV